MKSLFIGLLIILCFYSVPVFAAVTCSGDISTALQAAIDGASDGTTVSIAAGTCTLGTGILLANRNLTIQGAGIGSTNITFTASINAFETSGAAAWRITGLSLNETGVGYGSFVKVFGGTGWRIDHNAFRSDGFKYGIWIDAVMPGITYYPKGLIDNNTLTNHNILIFGRSHLDWNDVVSFGSSDSVYVEDNTFTLDISVGAWTVVDQNYGGKIVFRNNTINVPAIAPGGYDGDVTQHGIAGNNNYRGTRMMEVYNNVWSSLWDPGSSVAIWHKSGSGVVFGNSFIRYGADAMLLSDMRSPDPTFPTYGSCDGTAANNIDGNTAPTETYLGWPCRDQPGTGKDASLFVYASPPYPSQSLAPIYYWNNYRYASVDDYNLGIAYGTLTAAVVSGSGTNPTHIVSGRDFFNNDTTPKPGYTQWTYPFPITGGFPDYSGGGTTSTFTGSTTGKLQ